MSHGSTATGARHLRTIFALGAAGMLTDGQLLERFATRDGDRAELAFAALVERHGSMVLRVARGVSIDEHSAHDVFQATFLILARKARSLWVRDSLGPWLHGVAYRVASQARSREIRRKSREKDASRPESFEPHDADRADLIGAIHDEIDRLPQPFRLAVIACHLEGLTQQDAAERLGWPVGTLQSRLARGRQKLRSRLERRGLNPSLAILAVPRASVPPLLTSATAKAAVSLNLGKAITGMIAPTVLAMIQTTTKGMLMTKLKLGAAAALMAIGGIVGTGMATGVGRPIQATDEPKPASTAVAPRVHLPPMSGSKTDEPIPLPEEDSSETTLLYFHNNDPELNQTMKPVLESLLHNGYTVKSIDLQRFPSYREKFKVESVPSYVLLVGGTPFRQSEGVKTASQLAEFYNDVFGLKEEAADNASKPSPKEDTTDVIPPPAEGPGFPYLLDFDHSNSERDRQEHLAEINKLIQKGYPIKSVDSRIFGGGRPASPGYVLSGQYEVNAWPTILLVDGSGAEIARLPRMSTLAEIAAFYNENRTKSPRKARPIEVGSNEKPEKPVKEPGFEIPFIPKPWETAVRLEIRTSNRSVGFSSGVVILSTDKGSIILTSAHNFISHERSKMIPETVPPANEFKGQVTVDVFDGKLVSSRTGEPRWAGILESGLPAKLLALDLESDLAVVQVLTDRRLPVSPLVPTDWKPQAGTKLVTVGCSGLSNPTVWETKILDPAAPYLKPAYNQSPALLTRLIKCEHEPAPGRSGGGLFTTEGYLVGICNFADPDEQAGLYQTPNEIRRFLTTKKLDIVYENTTDALAKFSQFDIAGKVVLEKEPPAPEEPAQESKVVPPAETPPATVRDDPQPKTEALHPQNAAPKSNDQRRIDDLEKKLDQVLKALEDLKGKANPE